jgi:hypothetical protein
VTVIKRRKSAKLTEKGENMVKVTREESEFVVVKPDMYVAEYHGCVDHTIPDKKKIAAGDLKAVKSVFKHLWEIEYQGKKVELDELSDKRITGKNKLGAIVAALLGRDTKVKEEIELDSLVGKKAKLMVKNKPSTTSSAIYNEITDHVAL